ncbi:MAG: hypothetical protein J7L71_11575, partial [Spirochaetaceae bacterium]|nr:hypothetical protein [Spirochaetaceae bacterium]
DQTSVINGHLEEGVDSNYDGNDPDVSGTIKFTGTASDDQGMKKIGLVLNSVSYTLADWSGGSGLFESQDPNFFIVSQDIDPNTGHEITWTYTWDTNNTIGNDISALFTVDDFRPLPNQDTGSMTVDEVPYISKIENISGYGVANDVIRTATGGYSVDQDTSLSNLLRIYGFNLGSSPSVFVSTDPANPAAGEDISANVQAGGSNNLIEISKDIIFSGYLTLQVNGIYSINNVNNNTIEENKEKIVYLPVSEQWTDDRYLYLWDTTMVLPSVNNQTFYYPDMIMENNQPIFSYNDDNSGRTRRTTGDSSSQPLGGLWYERQTSIQRDDNGNYWTLSVEDAFSGGSIGFLYMNRDRNASAAVGTPGNNFIEIIGEDYIDRQLNRFRYPKLILSGPANNSQAYIAYYDFHNSVKGLVVSAFNISGQNSSTFTEPGNDSQRSVDLIDVPGTIGGNSSEYFDIEVVGSLLTIAYYDEASSSLIVQFNDTGLDANGKLIDGSAGGWGSITVEDGTYAGSYVSAANDGVNVYLSYYDIGNANLKMAVIPVTMLDRVSPSGAISKYTIDSYLSVGSWTQIEINNSVPVISYYAESYGGTKSSIRYAFPTTNIAGLDDGVLINSSTDINEYSGKWEIVTVPAISVPVGGMPQFNHTQLGFYADTTSLPVIGWLGSKLEYSKLKREK